LSGDSRGRFDFDDPANAQSFVDDVAYLDRAYW